MSNFQIRQAKKRSLFANAHKLSSGRTVRFASFGDINILVTSRPVKDSSLKSQLENASVEIIAREFDCDGM